jgi:hypothetical protein
MSLTTVATLLFAMAVGAPQAPATTASIGTARLPMAVMADGKPLPAGTYQVRLTTEAPAAVVGQTPAAARWVEFLKDGAVVGREVATVVPADDMGTIAKMPRGSGTVRVQTLKGGDYVRVWVIHSGTHVLIHLAVTP